MRKFKYPDEFYKVVRQFLGTCPVCSVQLDSNAVNKQEACNVFRTSKSSVTMHCRQCGLYFAVTWKALASAIGKKADTIANREDKEKVYSFYAKAFETIDSNVSTIGIFRSDITKLSKKRLLKKILKSKL